MKKLIVILFLFSVTMLTGCPSTEEVGGSIGPYQTGTTQVNCNTIQEYLEAHFTDNDSVYPEDLSGILITENLEDLENPVTRELVKDVAFKAPNSWCEVTYIPIETEGQIQNYILIGYRSELVDSRSLDVDGDDVSDNVLLILTGTGNSPEVPVVDRTDISQYL